MRPYWVTRFARGVYRTLGSITRCIGSWLHRAPKLPVKPSSSRLIFAEKSLSITHPIHLVARIDRAYRDGEALALLELKFRRSNHVYESDIIELSAQRVALIHGIRQRVHDYGYVEIFNTKSGRRTVQKVRLHPEHRVNDIAHRRRLLLAGAIAPRGCVNKACCRHCEYRAECGAFFSMSPGDSN